MFKTKFDQLVSMFIFHQWNNKACLSFIEQWKESTNITSGVHLINTILSHEATGEELWMAMKWHNSRW